MKITASNFARQAKNTNRGIKGIPEGFYERTCNSHIVGARWHRPRNDGDVCLFRRVLDSWKGIPVFPEEGCSEVINNAYKCYY